MKLKFTFLLLVVIGIALSLRLWSLGQVPPSPDWDEAALGYNAYSILQTGRDEYGKFMPLVLRSFDDYKPGLYTYFIIPLLPLFGLNIISVRLPSALLGVATVIATYFLVKELLITKEDKKNQLHEKWLALLSALFMAISPWHIQFSRIAFESNVGVAFNVFGALAFVKGLRNPLLLIVSVIFFAANIYVYQSNKVFAPLLFMALVLIYKDSLLKISKKVIVACILVGLIIGMPMVISTLTDKASLARAQGVSVFSDQTQFLKNNAQRINRDNQNNNVLGLIVDNRRIEYIKAVIAGYIAHFDLNWLFITGDLPRHHAPYMGLFYIWQLPFVLLGIYMAIFGNFAKRTKLLLFSWFLLAPLPASITSGVPHAIRTLNFLPIYPIFIAIGIVGAYFAWLRINLSILKKLIGVLFMIFVLFNFLYFLNQYFVQLNYYTSQDWQYGYKEAVDVVKEREKDYEKIVVSNTPHLDQSYMFFLFYLQYPPSEYQKYSQKASGGFREDHVFGKYEFRRINWDNEDNSIKTLYIGRPGDFPETIKTIKTINFLDGKPAIKIVERNSN